MALPPQTDVFQPLSKAAFISSWEGKHHNLGSHVSCLSVRYCQLFLQHPRVLWQSREQVTHLSKGSSDNTIHVPDFFFPLNRLEIKSLCIAHFFYCTLIFFAFHCFMDWPCTLQNPQCRFSIRTFSMELWHVGGADVPWEQTLSHQWPTAEQNYTYCKRSKISLIDFRSCQLLLFYIEIETGHFL